MALTVQLVPAGVIMEVSVKQTVLEGWRRLGFGAGGVSDCEKIGRKAPGAGEREKDFYSVSFGELGFLRAVMIRFLLQIA